LLLFFKGVSCTAGKPLILSHVVPREENFSLLKTALYVLLLRSESFFLVQLPLFFSAIEHTAMGIPCGQIWHSYFFPDPI